MRRWLSPERLALGFAALAGLIVLWNAITYPSGAGYDAASHKEYGDFLIDHLRLPHENETPEYYSPPLYYMISGGLTWLAREAGLGEPHKVAQLWNVPVAVATVLLVIALARVLAPERRWLAPAAAGFVALSPVFTRTAAMINPEPTDLLVSVLCLYLAARIFTGRRYGVGAAIGLGSRSVRARWCGSSRSGRSPSSCSRSAQRSGCEPVSDAPSCARSR